MKTIFPAKFGNFDGVVVVEGRILARAKNSRGGVVFLVGGRLHSCLDALKFSDGFFTPVNGQKTNNVTMESVFG